MVKRKFSFLIALLAIVCAIIVLALFKNNSGIALKLWVSPTSAIAEINGKKYEINQKKTIRLAAGKYTIKVTANGFQDATKQINLSRESSDQPVIFSLAATDNEAKIKLYEEKESLWREEILSLKENNDAQKITEQNPIINSLPYIAKDFRIDYGPSASTEFGQVIYITSDTETSKQKALDWITSKGYNPSSLEIVYRKYSDLGLEGGGV